MLLRGAPIDPPAIVAQVADFQRCRCPECLRLDREFPGEGYQLALFPFVISLRPKLGNPSGLR